MKIVLRKNIYQRIAFLLYRFKNEINKQKKNNGQERPPIYSRIPVRKPVYFEFKIAFNVINFAKEKEGNFKAICIKELMLKPGNDGCQKSWRAIKEK